MSRLRAKKQNQGSFSPYSSPRPNSSGSSSLSNLYNQQRKLTAAKYATSDQTIKRTLEQRSSMLDRRIGRLQTETKTNF